MPELQGKVGFFLNTAEGRSYLVRLPNIAFSTLSDAELAEMLNYMVVTIGGATMATRPDRDGFVMVSFPDLRRDAAMGFFCSKAVAPSVLQQLNAAITRQLPRLRSLFPDQAVAAQP